MALYSIRISNTGFLWTFWNSTLSPGGRLNKVNHNLLNCKRKLTLQSSCRRRVKVNNLSCLYHTITHPHSSDLGFMLKSKLSSSALCRGYSGMDNSIKRNSDSLFERYDDEDVHESDCDTTDSSAQVRQVPLNYGKRWRYGAVIPRMKTVSGNSSSGTSTLASFFGKKCSFLNISYTHWTKQSIRPTIIFMHNITCQCQCILYYIHVSCLYIWRALHGMKWNI